MIKLDAVTPIQFKDMILVPLKVEITKLFGTNKVEFQIYIKENKIIIESPHLPRFLDFHDRHLELEAINVS